MMKRIITLLIIFISIFNFSFAADRIFFVSRNLNKNIIVYDIQLKDGKLDTDKPLHVYWYNQENNPVTTKELNFIQRKMAYGYTVSSTGNNEAKIKLKAYNKREIHICKHNGKWVALALINGKDCILTEIYAHCPSRTSCDFVELRGKAVSDGSVQKEKVK